ncbi:MAG: hypothetical protein Q7J27_04315 [Syntrophales bacterium]|nr:hypothetical protein [Syntrophales bacterium]
MTNKSMKMNVMISDHPEYAKYIANIITTWNSTEHALGSVFAIVVGTDPWHSGRILGAIANSGAKLALVESAGKYTLEYSPLLEEFNNLIAELKTIIKSRNTYAHGVYAIDNKGRLNILRQGRDWTNQKGRKLLNMKQLKDQWQKSIKAFNNVIRFHNLLCQEMPQSPSSVWLYRCQTQARHYQTHTPDQQPVLESNDIKP